MNSYLRTVSFSASLQRQRPFHFQAPTYLPFSEAFHSSMQQKLHKPPHNNCLMKMIIKMRFLLASVVTAAVIPNYSFGWDSGWDDWGSGGRKPKPTHSPTKKHPSSNTWGSPSWWNGDNNPTDWDGWWGSGYAWEWTGDGWNWTSKQKPTSSPTPSPSLCECDEDLSEEECQAQKIAVEKQMKQIIGFQKQLEQLGVVPIGYDDFKYLELLCLRAAMANYIEYLKMQNQNYITATGDGDCKEIARNNYCASNCKGLTVSYGNGCKERETPRDITSCAEASDFNAEVIQILPEQLQIAALEGQLSCDIC